MLARKSMTARSVHTVGVISSSEPRMKLTCRSETGSDQWPRSNSFDNKTMSSMAQEPSLPGIKCYLNSWSAQNDGRSALAIQTLVRKAG